jgi:putative salt-induced outer membrane protein
MKYLSAAAIGLVLAMAGSAAAQEAPAIPDIAQALLNAAYESGDPAEITAVAKAVKAVFPDYEAAITAQTTQTIASFTPPEAVEIDAKTQTSQPASSGGLLALSPWDGKIEASALLSSGNSENSAVGILIDAARTSGDFVHNIDAFFNLGSSNGITNQKRWGAAYKLDYSLGEHTYAFGRIAYEEDEFSGFDYRVFAGAGLGRFLAQSEPFTWKVEGGPGFRYSPIDATSVIEQEFAAYASSEMDWLIREGLTFEQDWNVTWTSPTTTFRSVTALTTQLWGDISTGVSFEYRYETGPPAGRKKTDTIAKASVIYGF